MEDGNHTKGRYFEKYVYNLLDRRSCSAHWLNEKVELSDCSDIDAYFRHKGNQIPVCLQCKFRTLDNSYISWFDKENQMSKYLEYEFEKNTFEKSVYIKDLLFFIVFGLGKYDEISQHCTIQRLFIVPLHEIPEKPPDIILISEIEKYEVLDLKHKLKFLPNKRVFKTLCDCIDN